MANHAINWKKRILLPFWIVRICLSLIILIGFSAAISLDEDEAGMVIRKSPAIAFLVFTIIVLLLDAVQIFLWSRDRLSAPYFAALTIIQALFWGLVMVLDIALIAKGQQSSGGIGLVIIMFLLYFGLFMYALRGYMRLRKIDQRGHYAPAHNPKTSTDMEPYPRPASDQKATIRHVPMHDGGDLGQSENLIPMHNESQYHDNPPTKSTYPI